MKLIWVHSAPGECEYDIKQAYLQFDVPFKIWEILNSENYDLCFLRYPNNT